MVSVVAFDSAGSLARAQQGDTAASHNAFFHRSAGGVQGIFDAGFFLFHFHFGGRTDFDHGNTASQFGYALLQFFLVVVAGGFFDLLADLFHARFDISGSACAVDDGGVFFAHFYANSRAQVFQSHFFQRQANFFGNDFAACQDGDVFQHGFATVAKAWGFNGNDFQDATDGVDHQRSQGFAIYIFSDDEQRTARFSHLLQRRQQFADVADFFVVQQHEGVFQNGGLLFWVVDEVG